MQRCEVCNRPMTLLFTSYACDYCDGLVDFSGLNRAYVAWPRDERRVRSTYLFPSRQVAEHWMLTTGLIDHEVREVATEDVITWHLSRGTIRGIEIADHLFEVYPDHRFQAAPHRAFLIAPDEETELDLNPFTADSLTLFS